jgi:hypothetical protein
MGWEDRNGRSYYYRKERDGARVRSCYVGGGEAGRLLAQLDGMDRAEAEAERAAVRLHRRGAAEEDRAFAEIAGLVEGVTAAHLLVEGFHTHKRQWRLIRGGKK